MQNLIYYPVLIDFLCHAAPMVFLRGSLVACLEIKIEAVSLSTANAYENKAGHKQTTSNQSTDHLDPTCWPAVRR